MEKWTAPAIASLRGDNTIPLQRTFASLTEYLSTISIPDGGTAGQILSKIDATDYNTEWIDNFAEKTKCLVKSDNAATLPKGAVVYTSGANGTNILVKGAIATSDATSATVLGLLETSLAHNDQGYVITEGLISGIDTSAATAGDPVWLSPTVVGGLLFGLANKPHAPYHLVYLGVVTRAHAVNGEINVHLLNGWELEELHNVSALSPSNGDTIVYNSTTSLWEKGKYPADQLSGTALPATIVTSSLTSVGTLSSGSIPSSLITGTLSSALLSGSYTGITGVGTLSAGSIPATLLTGTVDSARISGSYTGITAVGTLGALSVNGTISGINYTASSNNYYVTGSTSSGGGINNGNLGYTGANADSAMPWCTGPALGGRTGWAFYNQVYGGWRMGYRCNTGNTVRYLWCADYTILGSAPNDALATHPLVVNGDARILSSAIVTNYLVSTASPTGSGNAAQWVNVFGAYYLVRNTSTRDDKENFQPLNGAITPSMVDDINVELWCRKGTGFPEVGPMAEDMDAISPYLSNRGMNVDDDGNIIATPPNGINQNAWLSLLTIALQDCRRRITQLETL